MNEETKINPETGLPYVPYKLEQITNKLKQIIHSDKDKDVAIALGIKPTTFASQKRRQRTPYASIIRYCRAHHINANEVLLDIAVEEGKVLVRYFRSLEDYGKFLGQS